MAETKLKLVKSDFNLSAGKTLYSLFEDSNFSDVTLVSEDHNHIQAHRVILSAGSQFFKDTLEKKPSPTSGSLPPVKTLDHGICGQISLPR